MSNTDDVPSPTGQQLNDPVARPDEIGESQTEGNFSEHMLKGRRAILIVLAMVAVADVTLYHAAGFTGPAGFFLGATILVYFGIPKRVIGITCILLTLMLGMLAARLAWNGWAMQVVVGFWILHAIVVSLRGHTPFVLETMVFAAECIPGGYQFFNSINDRVRKSVLAPADSGQTPRLLNYGLPIIAALMFGGIFVMANPDVVSWVSSRFGEIAQTLRDFLFHFSIWEIGFWGVVAWLTGGLLRPVIKPFIESPEAPSSVEAPIEAPLYPAFRNTLLTVIALFSAYLVFEFRTLWFREFPEGFYYAGYAHEGAAWLTTALGLATVMLSLIFRGLTLVDPRRSRLTKLAWCWSALNFVLALAVYNRMYIYIDFNGMTRMRIVGLLGISSVVGGFALVLVKINRGRDFLWLIRRQLWILGFAVYLYLILPVDVLIHSYNVGQVLAGNPAPVVQITGHEVDDEALPQLLPLCDLDDEQIRHGIQAFLSLRHRQLQGDRAKQMRLGWTAKQFSRDRAWNALEASREKWDVISGQAKQQAGWKRLQEHAYSNWW